jgi:uncharacterized protein involved in exopolysaccharide biosynthesis
MEAKDTSKMSNSELKLYLTSLENKFEAKKAKLKEMCEELEDIQFEYSNAQNELKIRKNIYL